MVTLLISALISAIIAPLIREEFQARGQRWALMIVWWAVQELPEDRRDRYFEEWCAHLDSAPTPLSKVLAALGFSLAAIRMDMMAGGSQRVKVRFDDLAIRGVDIMMSLGAIIVLAPAIALSAFAMFVSETMYSSKPGPVMFKSRKVGRGGREIDLYKLRTLPLWNGGQETGSNRINRVGLFLRSASVDELPQLINVLNGTMSLIGPRPIAHGALARQGRHSRYYMSVKPGISGLAWRSDAGRLTERRQIALTRLYARKRSLRVYLLLLSQTAVITIRQPMD